MTINNNNNNNIYKLFSGRYFNQQGEGHWRPHFNPELEFLCGNHRSDGAVNWINRLTGQTKYCRFPNLILKLTVMIQLKLD